jgi:hypothetical protein
MFYIKRLASATALKRDEISLLNSFNPFNQTFRELSYSVGSLAQTLAIKH